MINVLRHFFEALANGDPVALVIAAVLAGIATLVCLFWWKTARDLRREDEERKRRYGSGNKEP